MIKISLLTIAFVALVHTLQAQETTSVSNKILVYYPFSDANKNTNFSKLTAEIKSLVNVTDVKTEYKKGKQTAQLVVSVTYPVHPHESEVTFMPVMVKKALIENGYKPLQPRQVNVVTNN
jgi:hypothetical protein